MESKLPVWTGWKFDPNEHLCEELKQNDWLVHLIKMLTDRGWIEIFDYNGLDTNKRYVFIII